MFFTNAIKKVFFIAGLQLLLLAPSAHTMQQFSETSKLLSRRGIFGVAALVAAGIYAVHRIRSSHVNKKTEPAPLPSPQVVQVPSLQLAPAPITSAMQKPRATVSSAMAPAFCPPTLPSALQRQPAISASQIMAEALANKDAVITLQTPQLTVALSHISQAEQGPAIKLPAPTWASSSSSFVP